MAARESPWVVQVGIEDWTEKPMDGTFDKTNGRFLSWKVLGLWSVIPAKFHVTPRNNKSVRDASTTAHTHGHTHTHTPLCVVLGALGLLPYRSLPLYLCLSVRNAHCLDPVERRRLFRLFLPVGPVMFVGAGQDWPSKQASAG